MSFSTFLRAQSRRTILIENTLGKDVAKVRHSREGGNPVKQSKENQVHSDYKSRPVIRRYEGNPVLSAKDIPYPATLVFNAGVTKFNGKYVMVFRNDYGDAEKKELHGTNMGIATSDDGIHWTAADAPCFIMKTEEIHRAYDR